MKQHTFYGFTSVCIKEQFKEFTFFSLNAKIQQVQWQAKDKVAMFLKLWYQVKMNMSIDQKYAGLFWIVKLSIGKKFPNWF